MTKKKVSSSRIAGRSERGAGSLHAPSAAIVVEPQSIAVWDSGQHATTGTRVRAGLGVLAGKCVAVQISGNAIQYSKKRKYDGISDYSDHMGSY